MSTSDLYTVYKTKTKHIAEFPNSHGTAPVIWGYLCKKFLNIDYYSWTSAGKPLWDLAEDHRVSKELRLVHGFTFDNAICSMNKLNELADACEKVYDITYEDAPQYVNHWKNIAKALRDIKPDKRSKGIGLSCTSVSDPWISYEGERNTKLWNVFEIIK